MLPLFTPHAICEFDHNAVTGLIWGAPYSDTGAYLDIKSKVGRKQCMLFESTYSDQAVYCIASSHALKQTRIS